MNYLTERMKMPQLIASVRDEKSCSGVATVASDSKFDKSTPVAPASHPLVAAMASGSLTLPKVKVRVPLAVAFTTNGSGIAAGTVSVDPTTVSEASALDTLWSECRVLGGDLQFSVFGGAVGQFVLAYDPASNTALTSTVNGCQFAQHKLFVSDSSLSSGATATFHEGKSWSFPFQVPKGIKEGTTVGADQWSASGTSTSYGSVNIYGSGAISSTLIQGILYLNLEYRSRQ
jgi:hypothetical protein